MRLFVGKETSVVYRFPVWVNRADNLSNTLEVTCAGARQTWLWQEGSGIWECVTTGEQVELGLRAWHLGETIPAILADLIEERGEGAEWLLRLLREDPEWGDSLPGFMPTPVPIRIGPAGEELLRLIEGLQERYRLAAEESVDSSGRQWAMTRGLGVPSWAMGGVPPGTPWR